ncbi:MAG: zinc ribbon domain-containing protein [Chloroflexota bacterium]|nr:zinc ribbon domain-containing protein [Chloroflexota bacterium]
MPIYEYQCTSCGHNFEERQGFDADPVNTCPKCRSDARRLFKPAPIIFKGSGFYVTDYNGKSPSASEDKSEESTPVATETKKEESKPATTAVGTSESPASSND